MKWDGRFSLAVAEYTAKINNSAVCRSLIQIDFFISSPLFGKWHKGDDRHKDGGLKQLFGRRRSISQIKFKYQLFFSICGAVFLMKRRWLILFIILKAKD